MKHLQANSTKAFTASEMMDMLFDLRDEAWAWAIKNGETGPIADALDELEEKGEVESKVVKVEDAPDDKYYKIKRNA